MKKLLSLALACLLLFSLSACGREPKEEVSDEKPVIYLYPEQETDVRVTLDLAGELTCAYPAYGDGWSVRAAPDGTLTDESGQTYRYLYWEGTSGTDYDFSTGFCVSGEDTAAFLENALTQLGLNREEANEFIIYWLPQMQDNAYNLISFQQDVYTDSAKLTVDPAPDTLLRVHGVAAIGKICRPSRAGAFRARAHGLHGRRMGRLRGAVIRKERGR